MKSIKSKLLGLKKRSLLDGLDDYWSEFVCGLDLDALIDGYTSMLSFGQKGYSDLTKSELVNYIIRNLEEEDIDIYFARHINV